MHNLKFNFNNNTFLFLNNNKNYKYFESLNNFQIFVSLAPRKRHHFAYLFLPHTISLKKVVFFYEPFHRNQFSTTFSFGWKRRIANDRVRKIDYHCVPMHIYSKALLSIVEKNEIFFKNRNLVQLWNKKNTLMHSQIEIGSVRNAKMKAMIVTNQEHTEKSASDVTENKDISKNYFLKKQLLATAKWRNPVFEKRKCEKVSEEKSCVILTFHLVQSYCSC